MKASKVGVRELVSGLELSSTASSAPCICGGYCDATHDVTKEEIKEYQTCGRNYACCVEAFLCRVCKRSFIAKLAAPEMY